MVKCEIEILEHFAVRVVFYLQENQKKSNTQKEREPSYIRFAQ